MSECNICCGAFKIVHNCERCDYIICRTCARQIVNDYGDTLLGECAICLQCKKPLSIQARKKLLGITFVNVNLQKLRQKRIYTRQTHLFAETLPLVHTERRRRTLKSHLKDVNKQIREGQYELIGERQRIVRAILALNNSHEEVGVNKAILSRCAFEGCDGYLTDRGECNVCHKTTCMHCGFPRHEGHVCDPLVLASMSFIKKDCRPCVRCSAPSMRAEGCPVMWCVKCHTFWHWDTTTVIETRSHTPHNPDHREWLQRGGSTAREIGDIPCGGLPTAEELHAAFLREFATTLEVSPFAEYILNAADGVYQAQRMRNNFPITWNESQLTEPLRISFLIGDVNTEKFSRGLEKTLRLAEYKKEIGEILMVFVFSAADIFQRFCSPSTHSTCIEVATSLAALRIITNEAMASAFCDHERRVPILNERWSWAIPYRRHN